MEFNGIEKNIFEERPSIILAGSVESKVPRDPTGLDEPLLFAPCNPTLSEIRLTCNHVSIPSERLASLTSIASLSLGTQFRYYEPDIPGQVHSSRHLSLTSNLIILILPYKGARSSKAEPMVFFTSLQNEISCTLFHTHIKPTASQRHYYRRFRHETNCLSTILSGPFKACGIEDDRWLEEWP